ncbi:DUF896 domain-containing protein [Clostridium sp. KNHs214]|uniref:DUF896 domain-containing protein n=1 Tax=Clostridium sp. KNHs214 TaxID=1540257 RepID=UPI0009E05354|nr:DUF896 domain-containing protein [Clostridium sp. KNHs214]
MGMEELIGRINFLYKKSTDEGLTPEEKLEQKELRDQYIGIIKGNFRVQLNTLKKVSCR